jgi:hypothetical protein
MRVHNSNKCYYYLFLAEWHRVVVDASVHTMDELKLTGNALVGSRPILHFDAAFDDTPQFQVLKELFIQVKQTNSGNCASCLTTFGCC